MIDLKSITLEDLRFLPVEARVSFYDRVYSLLRVAAQNPCLPCYFTNVVTCDT